MTRSMFVVLKSLEPDTDIPLVLAYNMSHYESVHPDTHLDIEETVNLVKKYLNGQYEFGKHDLPQLLVWI